MDKWTGRQNGRNHCCKTEYRKKNENSSRDLWDTIKCTNIHIIGVPEGEEREKGSEKIFKEIIAENFHNMGKEIVNQVQKAQSPRQDKPKEEHTGTYSNQTDKI